MKCLAQSQGEKVRVNAVLPGLLLTEWVSVIDIFCEQDGMECAKHEQGQRFPPEKIQAYSDNSVLKKIVSIAHVMCITD